MLPTLTSIIIHKRPHTLKALRQVRILTRAICNTPWTVPLHAARLSLADLQRCCRSRRRRACRGRARRRRRRSRKPKVLLDAVRVTHNQAACRR
jgi:hypothetical protein